MNNTNKAIGDVSTAGTNGDGNRNSAIGTAGAADTADTADTANTANTAETREDMAQRHKAEQKNLTGTITGMKKQATKKTRKGVMTRCNEMQVDLENRHQRELGALDGTGGGDEREVRPEDLLAQMESATIADTDSTASGAADTTEQEGGGKRRNRQKERLAKRNAKIEQIRDDARREAANQVDYRKIEQESMEQVVRSAQLVVEDIKPDGHCLFASIQDQLLHRHSVEVSIQQLRETAAAYISAHADDFIPFLFDESTNSLRDIDGYVTELTSTAMWGSDMEILALACEYDCPISVYMAGAATITINEAGFNPALKLAFYKHSYGLGEHYNSLRDLVPV